MTPDDPRHGTNIGYNAGCRDQCCRHAHMVCMKRYRLYGGASTVSARGFERRVRALMTLGHTSRSISAELGRSKSFVQATLGQERVRPTTHAHMAEVYERLCMNPLEGWVAERARRRATEKGWAPPLAWDDIDNDDEPHQIRHKVRTHAELRAEYEFLIEAGESFDSIARKLGVKPTSLDEVLRRNAKKAA